MKKYNPISAAKRKEERKDFPEFFQKHIRIIKDNHLCCDECGAKLQGHVSEIAHVLPKSYFKSIATSDKNVIYLCGQYSDKGCHSTMDGSSNENFKKMLVYDKASKIFQTLEKEIKENINYKVYDRYC